MRPALIIVDMQNDFMPGGALAIEGADEIIPIINRIMKFFPRIIALRDYHPLGHVSFASSHLEANVFDTISVCGIEQTLWPDHCVQGTQGSMLHPKLNTALIHHVLQKGEHKEIDSYSAFFDNLHQKHTELDALLKKEGVDTVFLCGVATEYCVLYSAIDAIELGYRVFVISDACKGLDIHANDDNNAIQVMKKHGAAVITSHDVPVIMNE